MSNWRIHHWVWNKEVDLQLIKLISGHYVDNDCLLLMVTAHLNDDTLLFLIIQSECINSSPASLNIWLMECTSLNPIAVSDFSWLLPGIKKNFGNQVIIEPSLSGISTSTFLLSLIRSTIIKITFLQHNHTILTIKWI